MHFNQCPGKWGASGTRTHHPLVKGGCGAIRAKLGKWLRRGRGPPTHAPNTAGRLNAFGLQRGGGGRGVDGKVCSRDQRAEGSSLVRPGAASGTPSPKGASTGPPWPIQPAGAELCARKAWPGRAYNSHNAAPVGLGELQLPRGGARRSAYSKRAAESRPGLASKQRPGAGGKRESGR